MDKATTFTVANAAIDEAVSDAARRREKSAELIIAPAQSREQRWHDM